MDMEEASQEVRLQMATLGLSPPRGDAPAGCVRPPALLFLYTVAPEGLVHIHSWEFMSSSILEKAR